MASISTVVSALVVEEKNPHTKTLAEEHSHGRVASQDEKLEEASTSTTSTPEDVLPISQKRSITGFKWISVCVGLYLTAFLYGLDSTIAADVQAPIVQSLGHIQLLPWVGIGFPLGSVSTILLLGSFYGSFDIKWIYLGSIAVFEIGSALCGGAPTMNALIVGRTVAGVGGAGMYLGCLGYFGALTTLKERSVYTAGTGIWWGLGAILGPVIGGAFSSSAATWRWSFYINLVLAGVTAPIYIFWFPRYTYKPNVRTLTKLMEIDWVGFVLNAATFCLFVVVLTFAGTLWRWNSGGAIVIFVLVVVVLTAFALQQTFCMLTTPERRIFPIQFLKSRTMILLFFSTAAAATAMFFPIYYVPLFFQFTKGDTAINAAIRLLPFVIVFVFFVMLSGALLPHVGFYAPAFGFSGILIMVGGALMFKVNENTSVGAIYGYEALLAIGAGISAQMGYTIAAVKVAPEDVGAAIGFINVAQIGSGAITLAISGSIFENLGVVKLEKALAAYAFPRGELQNALSGVQSTILSSGSAEVRRLAVKAIVQTISDEYGLVIGAAVLLLVGSVLLRWEKLQFKGN